MITDSQDPDPAELARRQVMLTCLKENAKNIKREHHIMYRQYLEALQGHKADLALLDELISEDRVLEYRTMFRQVSEAVKESEAQIARIRELDYLFDQTIITFIRISLTMLSMPSPPGVVEQFCQILASIYNI